jgi:hypothetical protein
MGSDLVLEQSIDLSDILQHPLLPVVKKSLTPRFPIGVESFLEDFIARETVGNNG